VPRMNEKGGDRKILVAVSLAGSQLACGGHRKNWLRLVLRAARLSRNAPGSHAPYRATRDGRNKGKASINQRL
jgi:hypothetical protein